MGAQATGEVHRSHGGHYDVYQGGESFDDVIQVELEFLTGTQRRPTECSFDPTDQPSYVPKRAIAAHRSPNTLKHNMITKAAYFTGKPPYSTWPYSVVQLVPSCRGCDH